MTDLDGQYVVLVYRGNDTMLEWDGYAENPSDALNKALAQREEFVASLDQFTGDNDELMRRLARGSDGSASA